MTILSCVLNLFIILLILYPFSRYTEVLNFKVLSVSNLFFYIFLILMIQI